MNKYWILVALSCTAATYNKPCDQMVYDTLYSSVLKQALQDNNMKARNQSIQTLRNLCRGQESTFEHKNTQYQLRRVHGNHETN